MGVVEAKGKKRERGRETERDGWKDKTESK